MTDGSGRTTPAAVVGVILAGGRSLRYGSNKAFASLDGATLIEHVVRRAAPQIDRLIISAGEDARFPALGLPVVKDLLGDPGDGGLGPLAGVHAALHWLARQETPARWLASFAVDTPLLPPDLVARLRDAAERAGAEIACARSAGRLHPLLALWSPALRDDLARALERGERAAHRFIASRRAAVVDFPYGPLDPFSNVNTPADLARLARGLDP